MEIPDDLLCLFTGRIDERDDAYVVDVPSHEIDDGDLRPGEVYRVALLADEVDSTQPTGNTERAVPDNQREPPVEEGAVRTVEIEGLGDQGDGIARVDRGYVVIVPGTDIGDEVEVEIEETHQNFAMGRVVTDSAGEERQTADQ